MNLLVLAPVRLGYRLYLREPGLGLHSPGDVVHPNELHRWLRGPKLPLVVVFIGHPRPGAWLDVALHHHHAFVIPKAWLAAVPPTAIARRAALAARIVRLQSEHPIEHCYSKVQLDLDIPF